MKEQKKEVAVEEIFKEAFEKQSLDTSWKIMIERMFREFMEFYMPTMIPDHCIESPEFINKELEHITDDIKVIKMGKRYVDKLIKLPLRSNPKNYSLIHIEAQEQANKNFKYRILDYAALAYLNHKVPLTCLAIISIPSQAYDNKVEFNFHDTEINLKYKDYIIIDQDEKKLMQSNNPFALINFVNLIRLTHKKLSVQTILEKFRWAFKKMMKLKLTKIKIIPIYYTLEGCLIKSLSDDKILNTFEKEIKDITKNSQIMSYKEFKSMEDLFEAKGEVKGKVEGKAAGKAEEKLEVIESLLSDESLNLTTQKIAELAKVSRAYVEKVKKEMKNAFPVMKMA